jgi:hypothetical protein
MAQIILKTNTPEKDADVLKEALEIEASLPDISDIIDEVVGCL